jgi:hypothetical protein
VAAAAPAGVVQLAGGADAAGQAHAAAEQEALRMLLLALERDTLESAFKA